LREENFLPTYRTPTLLAREVFGGKMSGGRGVGYLGLNLMVLMGF
jgi:hypothetical protein